MYLSRSIYRHSRYLIFLQTTTEFPPTPIFSFSISEQQYYPTLPPQCRPTSSDNKGKHHNILPIPITPPPPTRPVSPKAPPLYSTPAQVGAAPAKNTRSQAAVCNAMKKPPPTTTPLSTYLPHYSPCPQSPSKRQPGEKQQSPCRRPHKRNPRPPLIARITAMVLLELEMILLKV